MITTGERLQRMTRTALGAALAAVPISASAASTLHPIGGEEQIVISIGPIESSNPAGSEFVWGDRLPLGVMLHRVSVELVDASGRPFDGTADWTAALLGASAWSMPLARHSMLVHSLVLPRPLGLRIDAMDSIVVRGRLATVSGPGPLHVQITLAYEPLGGPLARFAVLPLELRLPAPADTTDDAQPADILEWRAPVDGRVMVLVGLPADAAGELILEDVGSGATLWRETLQPLTGEGFGRAADIVRVGAAVKAGRAYRLTLRDPRAAGARLANRPVHALVAPVRTATVVAARD